MRKNLIDLFFLELSKKTTQDTEVIVTGAVAGALFGHSRPSLDIDFEIRPTKEKDPAYLEYLDGVIREISSNLKVDTNYGEDISHWSMIDYLDYRTKTIPYKKMGRLDIRLMAPEYWTIGKMARFLELDIQDMIKIIKIKRIPSDRLVKLWARALKASDLSLELGQFRQHVEFFLKKCGPRLWGKSYKAEKAVALFRKLAGVATSI